MSLIGLFRNFSDDSDCDVKEEEEEENLVGINCSSNILNSLRKLQIFGKERIRESACGKGIV